mmetsp:Transcript_542/g.2057  ORF Transcript_542/g.2057 Transcript_542/m.2057 type:complete len:260 (-) Transcript_542:450-1229(-)
MSALGATGPDSSFAGRTACVPPSKPAALALALAALVPERFEWFVRPSATRAETTFLHRWPRGASIFAFLGTGYLGRSCSYAQSSSPQREGSWCSLPPPVRCCAARGEPGSSLTPTRTAPLCWDGPARERCDESATLRRLEALALGLVGCAFWGLSKALGGVAANSCASSGVAVREAYSAAAASAAVRSLFTPSKPLRCCSCAALTASSSSFFGAKHRMSVPANEDERGSGVGLSHSWPSCSSVCAAISSVTYVDACRRR